MEEKCKMYSKISKWYISAIAKSVEERAKGLKAGRGRTVEGLACHVKEFSLYSTDNKKLWKISGVGRDNYFVLDS